MTTRALPILAVSLALAATASRAEEALYDPAPPPNSAFVRVVDAAPGDAGNASVGAVELDLTGNGVSSFMVVPAGTHRVTLGEAAAEAGFEAGNYYTVVFDEPGQAGPVVIKDDVLTNPAKAGLHFYNLSGQAGLTLKAPAQNVALFEGVGAGEMKFRPLGAVSVDLTVEANGEKVAEVGEVRLERRAAKSVIVLASAGGLHTLVVDNTVER